MIAGSTARALTVDCVSDAQGASAGFDMLFTLTGDLAQRVHLKPTDYRASFKDMVE